ncbi:2-phospho-L-lactate guanylyltransferase [Nocardioides marinisabuli]|uniref:2-phospho-L-lactate guanylyltransferase n=2 Tax=Nocardioides marinisabuli TaxID=419476 RepID=UPI0015CADB18
MTGWTAVVPVKRWALAKTRMVGGAQVREGLARAFALDLIGVLGDVVGIDALIIVTGEPELGFVGRQVGASVVEDRALPSADPLNRAIDLGRSHAAVIRPRSPIVVVPADLPALTAHATDQALHKLAQVRSSFVPDESGAGTTLLAAAEPSLLRPAYGPGSARLHAAQGAQMVVDVDPRVRRDVDTVRDLQEAVALGVGPRVRSIVEGLRASPSGACATA